MEDDQKQLRFSGDPDAKVGHKSVDSAFFGYNTHLAMSEERLITTAAVTTSEKSDAGESDERISRESERTVQNRSRNSELKKRHGYGAASYSGPSGVQIQGTMAIFAVNAKRILKLMEDQKKETKQKKKHDPV